MTPLRRTCLRNLGGVCICCGETQLEQLQIDHTHGGGSHHRRAIAPQKIEVILREQGYPSTLVDAVGVRHALQLLCRPCHHSKRQHGMCTINHLTELMEGNHVGIQDDALWDDSMRKPRDKDSAGRVPAGASVLLSTRVDPETKRKLERRTQHGAISLGRVIMALLDEVDEVGVAHHQETLALLQQILAEVSKPRDVPTHAPESSLKADQDYKYLEPNDEPLLDEQASQRPAETWPLQRWRRRLGIF